ncbi:hypothetical protein [Macrococcus carouselicus]|uniref:Uncharacterized protein n=1 Tax=Macrococcus carouselicus TaxID=69969 RepID=A0A9Q8CJJ4_9STAP|nr:hypothetical protein [Macrococcus carouselicus]TDM00691.1 hypothetical protein ERX40_09115 [Macrococcus carouselicus]
MSHVHLLAAWQQQNLEELKELIDKDVTATFVYRDGHVSYGDYNKLIEIFQQRFNTQQDWNFDIIHKSDRGEDSLVILKISREDKDYNQLDAPSICLFTFRMVDGINKLSRLHFELELDAQ